VLYRKVSAEKRPRVFSSGVTTGYTMEYADLAPEVRIEVKVQAGKGYLVEAAVPWRLLGGVPQPEVAYRGDFGITCGDPGGQRTRLRVYWNNQQTGLVDDVVYELQMTPRNWGELVFKP
jgi:hypothetical protein